MRASTFSRLLHWVKHSSALPIYASYRLSITCDKGVITTLRKALFWEMQTLGLNALQVTLNPGTTCGQICLSVYLECPRPLRQPLNEMALRLSQVPQIYRVRWGLVLPKNKVLKPRRAPLAKASLPSTLRSVSQVDGG